MKRAWLCNLVQLAVGVYVTTLVMHTWLLMGLVAPVTVAGSSMAPTLDGPRRVFHCDTCRSDFLVGIDQLVDAEQALCPRCGLAARKASSSDVRPDRLLIDRTAFALRAPRRWEVVVFRSPIDASELFVKRILGLPSETVALWPGGVEIDGNAVPLPPATQWKLRPGDRRDYRLGPTEYFVVGDNGEVSDDSRSWLTGAGLDAMLIVGKPLGVR